MLTAGVHSIAGSKGLDISAVLPNPEDFRRRAEAERGRANLARQHEAVMGMMSSGLAGEEEEL